MEEHDAIGHVQIGNGLCDTEEEFLQRLQEVGRRKYHDKHPFQIALNQGRLSREDVRLWIKNRFYYQLNIPVKDSLILSKLPGRDHRRRWIQRIVDHDGSDDAAGGIEAWLSFAEAAGISRQEMLAECAILPGVRFAVDAYVNFCRNRSWYEAVASSLTEMFAPQLIGERMQALQHHYPWIHQDGLTYFRDRLTRAPNDCNHALALVMEYATSRERQNEALSSLSFKCDVLWSLLDSIQLSCRTSSYRNSKPDG